MRGKGNLILIIFISLLLAFSVFGCAQEEATNVDQAEQADEIFIVSRGTDAETLDANWAYYAGKISYVA